MSLALTTFQDKLSDLSFSGPLKVIIIDEKPILLLGTAHVSKNSVDDVERAIQSGLFTDVAVELCPGRLQNIEQKQRWENLNLVQVFREKKHYLLFSSMLLASFQQKIGKETGVKPGAELAAAVSRSKEKNLKLHTIDRDIKITLKRAWQSTSTFSRSILISEMLASLFPSKNVTSDEIESLKSEDVLDQMLKDLPPRYNQIRNIIINERDEYMAQSIRDLKPNGPVLVVMGAGHLGGLYEALQSKRKIDLASLTYLKPGSKLRLILKSMPALIILGLLLYFFYSKPENIKEGILTWVGVKAAFSGVFPLLLRAHPLAILGALATGPISNFNPVLKPGWLAGITEAHFRKPMVLDFEKLAVDLESLKGVVQNRVSRVFLLFFLAQFGSLIGTLVALALIGN
jgi:pheromone shutdown-related protein TraB